MADIDFAIGQKVVCIDDKFWEVDREIIPNKPIAGVVYTVRSLHRDPHISGYGVRLVEVVNPICEFSDTGEQNEWSFMSIRFLPVINADQPRELELSEPRP